MSAYIRETNKLTCVNVQVGSLVREKDKSKLELCMSNIFCTVFRDCIVCVDRDDIDQLITSLR
jgi:hypothetical protein